jgi:pimeloyl-ACP methyl ester carboxylesterase
MTIVHHRRVSIDGYSVFYREAGPVDAPNVVLLHGAPSSSHMFRYLIPLLAGDYHVIAPDYLGFGFSDAPTVEDFDYTFEILTDSIEQLLRTLGVDHYAMYVQDYGAPVGWRLALRNPSQVVAIVTQNGNGYAEGLVEAFWAPLWTYTENPSEENAQPLRDALSLDSIRWQYTHGVPDVSTVDPDAWLHDYLAVQRPGNIDIQLALFRDYRTNVKLYPDLHRYLEHTQVPLLAVWGANDQIFGPAGAHAFNRHLPHAEIHLLDGGHWLLESHLDAVAAHLAPFLRRVLRDGAATQTVPT